MELKINEQLTIETEAPLLEVHEFSYIWKLNRHGILRLRGLLKPGADCRTEELYESMVKIREGEGGKRTIFNGCLTAIEVEAAGGVKNVNLEVTTGSCKLDRRKGSRSFQDVESTYEDTVRKIVESGGGRVICTAGKERTIKKPVIQYQETEWEFAKRLASHLGTCVMADTTTGKPNLWFGPRKPNEIPSLQAEDYLVHIVSKTNGANGKRTVYEVQSRQAFQIGDVSTFWGKPAVICEVRAAYQKGELIYTYLLTQELDSPITYQEQFTGMELAGTVEEVKGEQVKIALEIDGGTSTGNYFYRWYPETGNGMYAMPEKGAKIFLTFGSVDEREGFAVRCMLANTEEKKNWQNRTLKTREENTMLLNEAEVSITEKQQNEFLLSDQTISFTTPKKLRIRAGKSIKLQAKDIYIKTQDVVKVHQG